MVTCLYDQLTMEKILFESSKYLKVEGELFIPEEDPDMEQILFYQGYLSEVKGEIVGNKLFLSGIVEAHLLYRGKEVLDRAPEHGLIRKGADGAAFKGEIELPGFVADWDWQTRLTKICLQPETARTIKYQLELEVKLRARKNYQVDFVKGIESEAKLNTLVEQMVSEEPVLLTYTNREISNQFSISYPKPPVARILSYQVIPVNSTATLVKDRVNIEGKLEVYLVYLVLTEEGQEGGVEVQKWIEDNGGSIPFQITVDVPHTSNGLSINHEIWIEGVQIYSSHPENCRLQATIGAKVELFRAKPVKAVVEVSPGKDEIVDVLREISELIEVVEESERVIAVEKTLSLPSEMKNIRRVLLASITEPKLNCQLEDGQIFIAGETQFALVYQVDTDEEAPLLATAFWGQGEIEPITFGDYLEMPGVEEGMKARVYLNTNHLKVEQIDERTIKLFLDLKTRIKITQTKTLALVTDSALISPLDGPKPSMLFYLVQPGDTLWKIARRYNTTMESITQENQLTAESVVVGEKLLIPKKPWSPNNLI